MSDNEPMSDPEALAATVAELQSLRRRADAEITLCDCKYFSGHDPSYGSYGVCTCASRESPCPCHGARSLRDALLSAMNREMLKALPSLLSAAEALPAMQRRAESAESDWQAAEKRLADLRVTLSEYEARMTEEVLQRQVTAELLAGEKETAEKRVAALEAALGLDTPWAILDVLSKSADALDHLLRYHDCDNHGHEEVICARAACRDIAASLRDALSGGTSALDAERERAVAEERERCAQIVTGGRLEALREIVHALECDVRTAEALGYVEAYLAAKRECVIAAQAMLSRAERGEELRSTTPLAGASP
jgi:hypothetical protein